MEAAASNYIETTREFDAPPELVWRCWTEADHMREWHAQENCDIPVCAIDLRIGGRQFMCVRGFAGTEQEWSTYCGWTYQEIVPERRLAMLGFFADQDGNEVPASHYGATVWPDAVEISVELEPHNGGTRMKYLETVLPLPLQEKYINQIFDKLAAHLQKLQS